VSDTTIKTDTTQITYRGIIMGAGPILSMVVELANEEKFRNIEVSSSPISGKMDTVIVLENGTNIRFKGVIMDSGMITTFIMRLVRKGFNKISIIMEDSSSA